MSRVVISCDLIHPVGEVIFNALSTFDPNKQWPGTTWVRLKKCGLFGVDENDSKYSKAGTYIGENEHTMTVEEMAEHGHDMYSGYASGGSQGQDAIEFKQGLTNRNYYSSGTGGVLFVKKSGSSKPFNIVQRSYLGYYWLRTA